jgi:hypothetical protein
MFPSRQLTSEWVYILDWYMKCKLVFDEVRDCIGSQGTISEKSNHLIQDLISIGTEIIKSPPDKFQTTTPCDFHVNLCQISDIVKNQKETPSSCISLSRVYSCRYSSQLLLSILDFDYRLGLKGNVFLLKFFAWMIEASHYITKANQCRFRKGMQLQSMESAKQLLDSLVLPQCLEKLAGKDQILHFLYLKNYIPLHSLYQEANRVYTEALELFNEVGSISQDTTLQSIERFCERLKIVRSNVKALNDQGIGFNSNTSNDIEKYLKDLNWIKSTFDYPFIREYRNFPRRGPNNNGVSFEVFYSSKRILYSSFMQLYDKAPVRCRAKELTTALDHEMKSLYTRISNINSNISKWQTEVHNYMPGH